MILASMVISDFLFLLFFLAVGHAQYTTNTLFQGQVLTTSGYLLSSDDTFRLGFFFLVNTNVWYLGIAYNTPSYTAESRLLPFEYNASTGDYSRRAKAWRVYEGTYYYENGDVTSSQSIVYDTVWIANRDTPFRNDSGLLLTIDEYGKLKIVNSGTSPVELSSIKSTRNVSATLLDTGNFVLKEENGGRVLWQSFDYPTNTLLPGMKLGINFRTGHKWSLTSSINCNLPALGSYTLGADPNGSAQLMIWWRGEVIWRSGLWNEDHFEKVPMLSNRHNHSFYFVSTPNESYFMYSAERKYSFARYRMSYDGFVYEKDSVAPFGACAYWLRYVLREGDAEARRTKYDPGCADGLVKLPECRIDKLSTHLRKGIIYGHGFKYTSNNLSIYDCLELCFKNCTCVAFSYINADKTGCEIWNNDMEFIQANNPNRATRDVLFLNKVIWPQEFPVPRKSELWKWISIGTSVLLLLLVLCFAIFSLGKRFRLGAIGMLVLRTLANLITLWSGMAYQGIKSYIEYANSTRQPHQGSLLVNELADIRRLAQKRNTGARNSHLLQFFKFSTILTATDNFSPANKLGEGGFGSVYKGKLPDGHEVAIKRLAVNSVQGTYEFKNELVLIAKLQHTNLVRLVGCCINRDEKMLIYEYMPNKSLDYFLFDPSRKYVLDWRKRFNIAEGIAQGLLYLHKYSRLRIIHRDLKAGNILLDQDMNPKISDFGIAKIFGNHQSRANTNRVAGTFGYMPPEYAMEGVFSMKSDVYSFGVILLEIVSGRMNNSFYNPEQPLSLTGYAWDLWKDGKEIEVIDAVFSEDDEDSFNQNEAIRCIQVGLLCVQENPDDRPTMTDVVAMISYESIPLPFPKQPAFHVSRVSPSSYLSGEFHTVAESIQSPEGLNS